MPRGLAHNHDEKRAALRSGAATHFAALGFDRASMASVARSCNVSKALIYHYYDSKEALLFDILDQHLGGLARAVSNAGQHGTPEERLRDLIRAILSQYEDADAEHKLQIDALGTLPPDKQAPLIALQREIVAHMRQALETIAPNLGEKAVPVTMGVFGMLNWFYMWHRPGKGISRADFADLVTDMVRGGLPRL